MNRRDYDNIALTLATTRPTAYNYTTPYAFESARAQWEHIGEALAERFEKEDSTFDEERFLGICGID